jgi:hypothetical protein
MKPAGPRISIEVPAAEHYDQRTDCGNDNCEKQAKTIRME